MAKPAQLVAESAGDGYLRLSFKQGDSSMRTGHNNDEAYIVLQYPRQGEMIRDEGDPSATEEKVEILNVLLESFNKQLKEWCS